MIKISDISDIIPDLILADSNTTFHESFSTVVARPSRTVSYSKDTVTKEGLKLTAEEHG